MGNGQESVQVVSLREILSSGLHVAGLYRTSLKGAQMESLQVARLTPRGIEHDRLFMLVSAGDWKNGTAGEFVNQLVLPQMGLIKPQIKDGKFFASAPGLAIAVPIQKEGDVIVATMRDNTMDTVDQGDDAAKAFSQFLGVPLRLVRIREGHSRLAKPKYGAGHDYYQLGLQDGGQLTVGSVESRRNLNQRIIARGHVSVPDGIFRNNIMIAGNGIPHGEDSMQLLQIGNDVVVYLSRESARCNITTRHPLTAQRHPRGEPLSTMNGYRKMEGRGVIFDQNAIQSLDGEFPVDAIVGEICVGDRVVVLETKTPPFLYTGPLSEPIVPK